MSYIRLFILSISIISFPAYAIEEAETSVSKKLDHQLELNGKRYGVVGQSVIVLRNNKPYYEGRQGLSNVEFNIPVQKGHLFPSYSVTKLLTSTLVMQRPWRSAAWVAKVWRSSLGVTRIGKPAASPVARTMRRIQLTVIWLPRVL